MALFVFTTAILLQSMPDPAPNMHDLRSEAEEGITICRDALEDGNGIMVIDQVLCLSGHTNATLWEDYQHVSGKAFDTAIVRSAGGDANVALDIAEDWLDRGLMRVIVWDYCMSSCANWLFLAAEEKIQSGDNVVTWHGGPPRPDALTEAQRPYQASLARTYERSEAFYSRIGVDSSIMYTLPDGFNFDFGNAEFSFWISPRATLEQAGVTGLLVYDGMPEDNLSFIIR